jgi:DNA repair protein RadC
MKPAKLEVNMNGVAEVELIYHNKVRAADRPKVVNSEEAYKVFLDDWNMGHINFLEEFKVMLFNQANRVLGIFAPSRGGIAATYVDPRLIYVAALRAAASSIIVAHNHPSGELIPSRADEILTRRIAEGCGTLEIKFLDHLIITPENFFSFAKEGRL